MLAAAGLAQPLPQQAVWGPGGADKVEQTRQGVSKVEEGREGAQAASSTDGGQRGEGAVWPDLVQGAGSMWLGQLGGGQRCGVCGMAVVAGHMLLLGASTAVQCGPQG